MRTLPHRHRPSSGKIYTRQYFIACLGMGFDETHLDFRQPPRFAENLGRDGELADVVGAGSCVNTVDLFRRQSHSAGDGARQPGDTLLVSSGVGNSLFHCRGQGMDHFVEPSQCLFWCAVWKVVMVFRCPFLIYFPCSGLFFYPVEGLFF
ncbi:MAG: hypothetical protein KJ985_08290 [Proteobacteria bacterium]|nr:hypothetical protein [Pseudomonadota bacterium]MBU4235212.1 hypothetical protein [Pseudomonadota bacterium]MBU4585225.1 hypothetical protein [Pseudomonadota bacterium]